MLEVKLGAGSLKKSGVSEELQEMKLAACVFVRWCEGCVWIPGKKRRGWD